MLHILLRIQYIYDHATALERLRPWRADLVLRISKLSDNYVSRLKKLNYQQSLR